MTLRRLVLWRHGETEYNASGRMQGHLDAALTETGWNQARFAVPALTRFDPAVVVASDLQRAMHTATVFAEASGVELRVDKRLRETNLGDWQGYTSEQIEHASPGAIAAWRADATVVPPGGESRVAVAARAVDAIGDLDREFDDTVLVCAHGGLITALTCRLLDLPVATWPRIAGLGNCHWTVLDRRAELDRHDATTWRLVTYNAGMTG